MLHECQTGQIIFVDSRTARFGMPPEFTKKAFLESLGLTQSPTPSSAHALKTGFMFPTRQHAAVDPIAGRGHHLGDELRPTQSYGPSSHHNARLPNVCGSAAALDVHREDTAEAAGCS